MRKIKIFTDSNDLTLERRVNEWLSKRPAAIVFNFLSTESVLSDGCWIRSITIFYYEGEQGQ